jgi:hypothetical protein
MSEEYAKKVGIHYLRLYEGSYLTIRQRGRVVYEGIVNEDEVRVDYSLIDNEAELSNCFSIHSMSTIIYSKKILQKPQQNAGFLQ